MPGIDPAIAADKETDGQAEDPSVTLGKTGIADGDGVIHLELPVKRVDGFSVIIK